MLAFAGAFGVAGDGAFVPIQAEPLEAVEDHVRRLLGIAGNIRILDAQHKRSARMTGIQPVKQRRPRSPNVKEPCRTGRKSYTHTHF